mgnify:CR=1 FL=1
MKYIKLNKNWNAEPNAPDPVISESDQSIKLTFLLNSFVYQHIDDDDTGSLEFFEVYAYRLGSTNDEGYFRGQFRFKNEQLPWGQFYELIDSNWKKDFPLDMVILNDAINKSNLRHFIFFLRDETFECLAVEYQFKFTDKIFEKLESKYPKGSLNHYFALFASHFDKPTLNNYKSFNDLYIRMEGKDEFSNLQKELQIIKTNNDLDLYLKIVNYFEIEDFGTEQLNEMIKVLETYNVENK